MASTFNRPSSARSTRVAQPPGPSPHVNDLQSSQTVREPSVQAPRVLLPPRGVKPRAGGVALTSTGCADLDAILGGGQPLGTAVCLTSDRTRTLSQCLVKYWCAEGIQQEHRVIVPVAYTGSASIRSPASSWLDEEGDCYDDDKHYPERFPSQDSALELLRSLPRVVSRRPASSSRRPPTINAEPAPLEALAEEEEEEEEGNADSGVGEEDVSVINCFESKEASKDAEAGLKIAWQYRESVQLERLGMRDAAMAPPKSSSGSGSSLPADDDAFCHSFDLRRTWMSSGDNNGRPEDAVLLVPLANVPGPSSTVSARDQGFRDFLQLFECVRSVLSESTTDSLSASSVVVRLLLNLSQPAESSAALDCLAVSLPLLLAQLRARLWPAVILVVLPPSCCGSGNPAGASSEARRRTTTAVQRCCDVVLEAEHFAARDRGSYPPPAEFRRFQGLLHVRRCNTHVAATAHGTGGGGGGHFADWTVTKRPAATLYGLERNQRRLRLQLLHIPPEDYAQGGGSVGGGGVRSGAGRVSGAATPASSGCSSGGVALDF